MTNCHPMYYERDMFFEFTAEGKLLYGKDMCVGVTPGPAMDLFIAKCDSPTLGETLWSYDVRLRLFVLEGNPDEERWCLKHDYKSKERPLVMTNCNYSDRYQLWSFVKF